MLTYHTFQVTQLPPPTTLPGNTVLALYGRVVVVVFFIVLPTALKSYYIVLLYIFYWWGEGMVEFRVGRSMMDVWT